MAVAPRPSSPTSYLANGAICRTVFGAKSPVSARFWAKCGLDHFLANVWASGRFPHAWCDHRCVYGHGTGAASGSVRWRPACHTACQKTRPAGAAKRHDAAMANEVGPEPAVGHMADMASLYEHACSGLADQIHAVNRHGYNRPCSSAFRSVVEAVMAEFCMRKIQCVEAAVSLREAAWMPGRVAHFYRFHRHTVTCVVKAGCADPRTALRGRCAEVGGGIAKKRPMPHDHLPVLACGLWETVPSVWMSFLGGLP